MNAKWLKHSLRDGRSVVEYQIQPGERMDGVVLKNCKEEKVLGVLPVGASYEDGHNYIYAYTDKKETFAERLSDTITKENLLCGFESIVNTLIHMQEQEIDLAYVVLDPAYIFMEEQKARLICIPGKNAVMQQEELPEFFRTILANGVYLNSENGDYIAKLLSSVNGDFELKSFLRQIHGMMMDADIEIVEDAVNNKPEDAVSESTSETGLEATVEADSKTASEVIAEAASQTESETDVPVKSEKVEETATEEVNAEKVMTEEPPVAADETETLISPEISQAQVAPREDFSGSETHVVTNVIPEDEIEFEPIPEEMAAKIQRMNLNETEKNGSQASVTPQPVVQPQASVIPQPVVQPQASVTPQPVVQPQASVTPQPVVQPQASVTPQPVVQPQASVTPQPVVQPQTDGSPRPLIPPEAVLPQKNTAPQPQMAAGTPVSRPEVKKPRPHLTRVKTGEQIMLQDGGFVIGKSPTEATYTITDNPAVSRVHCTVLKKENGVFYVRDEHSTNSTYVNGEQVPPGTEKILLNNCKLVLGDEEFIYSLW